MNIRSLCLGILSFKEASGYEIKKMVEDGMFSHFIDASYGSIYPALTQMLRDELVTVRAEEHAGRPGKKVYAITQAGRDALCAALSVQPKRDKFKSEFLFQVLLMEHLPARRLGDVYDAQIDELRCKLERVKACRSTATSHTGEHFVNGYAQAVLSAAIDYLDQQRDHMLKPGQTVQAEAAE